MITVAGLIKKLLGVPQGAPILLQGSEDIEVVSNAYGLPNVVSLERKLKRSDPPDCGTTFKDLGFKDYPPHGYTEREFYEEHCGSGADSG